MSSVGPASWPLSALGALTACFIAALALLVPVWAAALIVTVVYGIIAGLLRLRAEKVAVTQDVIEEPVGLAAASGVETS